VEKRTTKLSVTIFILMIMRAVSHRVLWMTRLLLAQAVSQRDPFLATEVGVSSISPVKLLGGPEPRISGVCMRVALQRFGDYNDQGTTNLR
jgi:hypothetical protein